MNPIERFDESALVLPVAEAEGIAGPYRRKYTIDGAMGMPAHITILYPFFADDQWNENSRCSLARTISDITPFSFQLSRLCRFPQHHVLYLEPSPREEIIEVIHTMAQSFPECPPYGGEIPLEKVRPHMTVAVCSNNEELTHIEEDFSRTIASHIPLEVVAKELWFVVKTANKWVPLSRFPFESENAEQ